jgi:hypothetical protein
MNVVRHYAPREKLVAMFVEMSQAPSDDFCQVRISQMAFAPFDVQLVVKANCEGVRNLASFDHGEWAAAAGQLALHGLPLAPESARDFNWQRILKPIRDRVSRAFDFPMWQVSARADLHSAVLVVGNELTWHFARRARDACVGRRVYLGKKVAAGPAAVQPSSRRRYGTRRRYGARQGWRLRYHCLVKRLLLAAAIVVSTARCATIVNDTTEKIPVRSEPAGAVVSIECGNVPIYGGVTPTVITVPRAAQPCGITIAREGYAETRVKFERQYSRVGAGNKIAAAPAGVLVGLLGMLLTPGSSVIDPEVIGRIGYDVASSAAAAPANAIDEKSGGAFKQVPGEVDVRLERLREEAAPPADSARPSDSARTTADTRPPAPPR